MEGAMTAGTLIRAARRSRKLTQQALGRRARLSQSHLSLIERGHQNPSFDAVERALRAAGHRLVSVPTVRDDAAAIAADIRFAIADGRDDQALRRFIQLSDNLHAEHGAARFALAISPPEPTGSRQWDAALAAVVAHHLVVEHLPVPDWATAPARTLRRPWVLGEGPYTLTPSPDRVPPEFARRRVLIDEDTLVSV
jgi:transcriptional regulator with XRE-family HTH domain